MSSNRILELSMTMQLISAFAPRLDVREKDSLNNGDRLTQKEFHRRYERLRDDIRAELIGGMVYMASPLRVPHAKFALRLAAVLDAYETATPGAEAGSDATVILGPDSEPQPDLYLRLLPEYGGRT